MAVITVYHSIQQHIQYIALFTFTYMILLLPYISTKMKLLFEELAVILSVCGRYKYFRNTKGLMEYRPTLLEGHFWHRKSLHLCYTHSDRERAESVVVTLRGEKESLTSRVGELEGEVKKLRRELEEETEKTEGITGEVSRSSVIVREGTTIYM